jgi:hypothetical protein
MANQTAKLISLFLLSSGLSAWNKVRLFEHQARLVLTKTSAGSDLAQTPRPKEQSRTRP